MSEAAHRKLCLAMFALVSLGMIGTALEAARPSGFGPLPPAFPLASLFVGVVVPQVGYALASSLPGGRGPLPLSPILGDGWLLLLVATAAGSMQPGLMSGAESAAAKTLAFPLLLVSTVLIVARAVQLRRAARAGRP